MSYKQIETEHIYNNIEEKVKMFPEVENFYYSLRNSGRTQSVKTQECYINYVLRFLKQTNKSVKDITYDDITKYMTVVSYNKNGTKKSGSYMVAVYSGLKKFFTYLYASNKISFNPMEDMERPAPKPIDQVERTFLTKEEIKEIILEARKDDTLFGKRDLCIIELLLYTGMRIGALCNLTYEDVDLDNMVIKVIEKGNKMRVYELPKPLNDLITEYITDIIEYKLIKGCNNNLVFVSERCNVLSRKTAGIIIHDKCCINGKHITPHKLRATYATQMLNSGCSLYEVQQLMGHNSPTTTEIYIQGQQENIRNAAKKASEFVFV